MDCDELYISFLFPPDDDVSGITVFKRIIENNHPVDVLQSQIKSPKLRELDKYIDNYVNERKSINMDCKNDWWKCISKFINKGIKTIKKDYGKIYSRSWLMANHFLAYEYKLKNPCVYWRAEFSDPVIYDLNNQPKTYKEMIVDDDEYISKINSEIINLNNDGHDFSLIENNASAYFIAEYLVYLFADKIIFTNENQKDIMLRQFPEDVMDFVMNKIEIKKHPTLDEEFYHLKEAELELDNNNINMAYFGNDYYSKRHFESLFYAVEALNHKHKEKIKIDLYISNDKTLKGLLPSDRFAIKKPLEYLEFLNATTKYDVLIVNDLNTNGNYEFNPYMPSKLSDYMGSKSDIWALYEKGSTLSKADVTYSSQAIDYNACLNEMVKILDDNGFPDDNYSIDDNYLNNRLTQLNELYERELKQKNNFKRRYNKFKKENDEIKSSNSWKLTKSLKRLK